MILPENEFSLLKGVNNQPYLDIRTFASHLIKRFLFSCISLFSFLLSYVFYINPIGHFQVAFCLCVKPSLNIRNYSYDLHLQNSFSHKDLFWNRDTRIHSSMSCSQEPLIIPGLVIHKIAYTWCNLFLLSGTGPCTLALPAQKARFYWLGDSWPCVMISFWNLWIREA